MKCSKCKYSTSCLRAMISHMTDCAGLYSELTVPQNLLDREMHCICGFSSSEGNALARHLMTCGRSTAYPTVESAQENTVKRNMLDMLGLVRRDEDDDEDESMGGGDGALLVACSPKTSESAPIETHEEEEHIDKLDEANKEMDDEHLQPGDFAKQTTDEPMEEQTDGNAGSTNSAFTAALTLDDLAQIASNAELDQTAPICNTYQPVEAPNTTHEGDEDHLQKQQIEQFMESL